LSSEENGQNFDFTVDKTNLYREEAITDIKVASIRKMIPVNPDGSDDESRTAMFYGHTQLLSPEGPIPLQAPLPANNLEEALDAFPAAMEKALSEVVEHYKKMREEQARNEKETSRIIRP